MPHTSCRSHADGRMHRTVTHTNANIIIILCVPLQSIPPSDAKVFTDYILPCLSLLPNDPEDAVRVEYAAGEGQYTCSTWDSTVQYSCSMYAIQLLYMCSASSTLWYSAVQCGTRSMCLVEIVSGWFEGNRCGVVLFGLWSGGGRRGLWCNQKVVFTCK